MERKVGGLPGGEATGDFAYRGKAAALKEAGSNGGTVAAGAVDQEQTIFRDDGQVFREAAQRKIETAGDELLIAFARRADIHKERRLV